MVYVGTVIATGNFSSFFLIAYLYYNLHKIQPNDIFGFANINFSYKIYDV